MTGVGNLLPHTSNRARPTMQDCDNLRFCGYGGNRCICMCFYMKPTCVMSGDLADVGPSDMIGVEDLLPHASN